MKRNQIRLVVILGVFAIAGILVIQGYWLVNTWNVKERQFNQTVSIALLQVAEKMSALTQSVLPTPNPVSQQSHSYFVVHLNSAIDANILEHYLKTEFERHNIKTDFEYAIYDCHDDKLVYGNYVSFSGTEIPSRPTGNLPKYSDYAYYFVVNFPSKRHFLSADMKVWLVFTAITLVSVFFFGYAIFVILKQKRLSELQKDFINNMTHEFKTPISTINISADVLSSPEIIHQPERLKNYSKIIKEQNSRLNSLVEKVLQIARIEKSGFELKKEKVNIKDCITEVVKLFETHPENGLNASFKLFFHANNHEIIADRLHLTSILYNLIDNAVKYSGNQPEITLTTYNQKNKLFLEVRDNGPGIPEEYQKKIFDKFFRIPTGNVHNVKGFGLGLYYVKKVCEAHRWKIRLVSHPGKGSVFVIEIR